MISYYTDHGSPQEAALTKARDSGGVYFMGDRYPYRITAVERVADGPNAGRTLWTLVAVEEEPPTRHRDARHVVHTSEREGSMIVNGKPVPATTTTTVWSDGTRETRTCFFVPGTVNPDGIRFVCASPVDDRWRRDPVASAESLRAYPPGNWCLDPFASVPAQKPPAVTPWEPLPAGLTLNTKTPPPREG